MPSRNESNETDLKEVGVENIPPAARYLFSEEKPNLKPTTKKTTDPLLLSLLAELKKKGTRSGTGADMRKLRSQKP